MKPVIRDMGPEDADRKGYVHYASWQETYPGLVDSGYLARLTLEKCRSIAHRWPENTIIAELDGRIVGFSCYGKNENEIFALYLLKEAQGLGIGRKLMDAAIEKLDSAGPVFLWVLKGNSRAIGFYEHYGFQPEGTEQAILLGTPNTELRMVLRRP